MRMTLNVSKTTTAERIKETMKRITLLVLILFILVQLSVLAGIPLGSRVDQVPSTERWVSVAAVVMAIGALRVLFRPDKTVRLFAIIFALTAIINAFDRTSAVSVALFPLAMVAAFGLWWASGEPTRVAMREQAKKVFK